MKLRILICLLVFLPSGLPLLSQSFSRGTLQIEFTGLRSNKGMVAIGINTSPEGWPRKPDIELQWKKEKVLDGTFIVSVPDLPYGTMAISVLDDMNSNLEMDMTFGMPKEGFGFSNDAPVRLSPPKFEDCSFRFSRSGQMIRISLKYIGKDK